MSVRLIQNLQRRFSLAIINPGVLLNYFFIRVKKIPESPVQENINGVIFEFDFQFDPVIRSMFYGLYEIEVVQILTKFLNKADIFVDIGANIGYLSAIAAGCAGKPGQVHSFEPVPEYFSKLNDFAELNKDYQIFTNQCALGDKSGRADIDVTRLSNIGWNTMVPGFMRQDTCRYSVEVPIIRLDEYLRDQEVGQIRVIKIDTEGYEFPILKGLSDFFENAKSLPIIICEIAPAAYPLLGYTLQDLGNYLRGFNYYAYNLSAKSGIDITKLDRTTNVLFLNN